MSDNMADEQDYKIHAPINNEFSDFKGVVIDGANIITKNLPDGPAMTDVMRLIRLMNIVEALGWKVLVGLKHGTWHYHTKVDDSPMTEEDKIRLKHLVNTGKIDLINDKEDDYHLISVALNGPYYLLSRDRYKDWKEKNPKISSHIDNCLISVQWIGDEPSINLPANSKSTVIIGNSADTEKITLVHKATQNQFNAPIEKNIGRTWLASQCDLSSEGGVSREHFRFREINGKIMIEDLKSTNGTFIDGFRLAPNHPETITLGQSFKIASDEFELK